MHGGYVDICYVIVYTFVYVWNVLYHNFLIKKKSDDRDLKNKGVRHSNTRKCAQGGALPEETQEGHPLKYEFQVSNESFFSNFKKISKFSDLTGYAVFLFAKPGDPNKEACTKALFSEKPEWN